MAQRSKGGKGRCNEKCNEKCTAQILGWDTPMHKEILAGKITNKKTGTSYTVKSIHRKERFRWAA